MNQLTLDQKISLKGVFARKGIILPRLDMQQAVFLWRHCCGHDITAWPLYHGAH